MIVSGSYLALEREGAVFTKRKSPSGEKRHGASSRYHGRKGQMVFSGSKKIQNRKAENHTRGTGQ